MSELPNIQLYQENPLLKPLAPAQNDAPPEKKKSYDQMRWEHDYKMALEEKALDEAYKEKLQVGYTGVDFFLESAPLTGAYVRDDKVAFVEDAILLGLSAKMAPGKPAKLPPVEPYNRRLHYGRTPTAADRKALGAGPNEVVNHEPPLVKRYYEGDPKIDEIPGKDMTPAQRSASAADRDRMNLQPKDDSNKQGAEMQRYSMKKKAELQQKDE